MQSKLMGTLLLLAGALTLTLHVAGARSLHRAVSFELAEGNPLAWGLIASLCGVIGILARKLFAKGYIVRSVLLLLLVPGLVAVGMTPPASSLHLELFVLVCLLVWGWFGVMAFDNFNTFLIILSGSMVAVPILFLMSPGLGERVLIGYALTSCGLVYYHHLDEDTPVPWKTEQVTEAEDVYSSAFPAAADFTGFPHLPAPSTPAPLLWKEPDQN